MHTAPSARTTPAIQSSHTDGELAERAAGGEPGAFEAIMRRHNRLLFRTARSILKIDAEAEDALQEAYLRAWRALAAFRADAKLSTWLVRIVVNESLQRLRRHGAQVINFDAGLVPAEDTTRAEELMEDDPSGRPETAALRGEARRLIEAHIDALPNVFRIVFMLRAVEELTVEETAAALDVPEATVRTRYFRARGLLRASLARDVDLAVGDAHAFAGARCDRIVSQVLAHLLNPAANQL
jgi:RNA polymerase sigma-70 factor (ECF subfamily)